MANFSDYLRDFIFPLLLGILGGRSREARLYDHAVQKVLSSADVPPEKLLDPPASPRCKNLLSFSLFCTFCFPRFYCVNFFVSFHRGRVDPILLEREARGAGETLTSDVTSTSSYIVIDANILIDLKVSVDSFEFYL